MHRIAYVALALALTVLLPVGYPVSAQSPSPVERQISERLKASNGIRVGEPKVYDDALLQQMLGAAEARLAAIQLLDQTGLAAKLGAVTGFNQTATSLSVAVQTPSLPDVTTTEKGATEQVLEKTTATSTSTDTTTNRATTDVVTKAPATSVPTATPAGPSVGMPNGFSVSASDLLNEQMQLTFEIANLRLLLDGALSDRLFQTGDDLHRLKPRSTIGIPIDIDPKREYKHAVAIVEVEVSRKRTLAAGADISLTALLPREKTYNVAAIRESNLNIGGGVVTQIVGVGGGFLRSRKTYYIVQDQDTIAQTFEPSAAHTMGIAWQFRPVLGLEYVRSRQTQTFMQLAFPTLPGDEGFAALTIRSYWRKYDRKNGVLKDVIPGSLNEKVFRTTIDGTEVARKDWSIPTFSTTIPTLEFNDRHLEDLGGGQMLVTIPTQLMTGTSLRIGPTIVRDGAPNVVYSASGMKFAASLSDLVTKRVALIGRDGQETPLIIERQLPAPKGQKTPVDAPAPAIQSVTAHPLDETSSLVQVTLSRDLDTLLPRPVMVIGNRVFGYADAPIVREKRSLSAVVPTSLLQNNPQVQVTALFAPAGYHDAKPLDGTSLRSRVERIVLLAEAADQSKFLLYGSRLSGAKVLVPVTGASLESVPGAAADDVDTLALLTIKSDALKGLKQVALQRKGERPIFVAMPAVEAPKRPEPKARERAVVNADAAIFDSDGLATLGSVTFEKRTLTASVSQDKKSVTVSGLRAAGITAAPGTATLEFAFGDTKVQARLEIVSARIETVAK